MRIILSGCNGAMGRAVTDVAVEAEKAEIVAGVDRTPDKFTNGYPVFKSFEELDRFDLQADAVIDFSHPFYLGQILDYSKRKALPLVLAATGYSKDEEKLIEEAGKSVPIIFSHNTSKGVSVLLKLAATAASLLDESDIEIVEKHSRNKLDSPSGTTHMIVEALKKNSGREFEEVFGRKGLANMRKPCEIGIHSVRAGGNRSEHSVSFTTMGDMLEIRHTTFSYDIFARGAMDAAAFLHGKEAGLYDMGEIIK